MEHPRGRRLARRPDLGRVLLAAAAGLLVLGPAAGQDSALAAEAEARAREAGRIAAARLAAFGQWCQGRRYRAKAREQWRLALRFDPEEPTARKGLGFRRTEEGWKDPVRRDESPDAPMTRSFTVDAAERESDAAHTVGAEAFAAHAAWCVDRGLEEEAEAAFWTVLWFDPAHEGARKALSLAGLDTSWMRPKDAGPKELGARLRDLAAEPLRPMPPESDSDRYPYSLRKEVGYTDTREARFGARSWHPQANSRELLDGMLRTETVLVGMGLVPAWDGKSDRLTVFCVETKELYDAMIRGHSTWDAKKKESMTKFTGCWWTSDTYLSWSSWGIYARDSAAHATSHHSTHTALQGRKAFPPWASEGAAHLASTAVLGTAWTKCASLKGSAVRRTMPGGEDWDGLAREIIGQGTDPPLAVLAKAGTNDLTVESLVKSRSVVGWLASGSPETLRAFLMASRGDTSADAAGRRVFGCPLEAVDRRWRMWARRP